MGERGQARRRWVGVGRSTLPDSRAAVVEAARAALDGEDPCLVIVFFARSHDAQAIADGAAEVAGDVPVIGCSTAGELSCTGPARGSVLVTAFGGSGFAASTRAAEEGAEGLRTASAEAAACLDDVEGYPHRLVLLLAEGLADDQRDVVRGAYETVGAGIPIVGGFAGDDLTFTGTTLIRGRRVLRSGTVAAAIGSDAPMGVGVDHGWERTGPAFEVTAATGNTVHRLDEQPALDAYLSHHEAPPQAWVDPAAFAAFARCHPLGVLRRRVEEVRFTADADFATRSLVVGTEIPVGAQVHMLCGDEASMLAAAGCAARGAIADLGAQRPAGLIVFDCAARRAVLGEAGAVAEVSELVGEASGTPLSGFYTYGEIARVGGGTGVHNQTVVAVAFA